MARSASGTVEIESLTRDVLLIPAEGPQSVDGFFKLGDKADTDDSILDGRERDPKFQPLPIRTMSQADFDALGKPAIALIREYEGMRRLRVREN